MTKPEILNFLTEVLDPEVPVLSIVDLGIVRGVVVKDNLVEVVITPTYSGCPAMKVIEDDIISKLKEKGIAEVSIKTVLSPAWTTDWISAEAKEKLRKYGIAPPEKNISDVGLEISDLEIRNHKCEIRNKNISCPNCKSQQTELISQFGSTACKALYRCLSCKEPFDYFKCI